MIQSTTPVVIGINGPPGIGKSWFSMKILPLICHQGRLAVRVMCPRDFIWDEVRTLYNWTGDLGEFKTHVFQDGRAGREHMIEHAEMRRNQDRHYWAKKFIEDRKFQAADVVVNDSVAFPEEHKFLLSHIPDFISVVIAPTEYSIGSYYPDNYRRCIAPVGGFRAINSTIALDIFKTRLKNAQSPDSAEDSKAWKRLALARPLVQS